MIELMLTLIIINILITAALSVWMWRVVRFLRRNTFATLPNEKQETAKLPKVRTMWG